MPEVKINNPNNSCSVYLGDISGLYGDILHGWAINKEDPTEPVVIEVFVDGVSSSYIRADEYRISHEGSGQFNGFSLKLRDRWLTDAQRISARIANTQFWLSGSLELPCVVPTTPIPVASQVWHTGGLNLSGWAYDATQPERTVTVIAYEGERELCSSPAAHPHQALSYRDSTNHGFELALPWELADGTIHILEIKNDLGHVLTGSPITLCCIPEGLEAILRPHEEKVLNSETLNLVNRLAHHQESMLPKSAAFSHYPDWYKKFQIQPKSNVQESHLVGVIIISEGCEQLDNITITSLELQNKKAYRTNIGNKYDLKRSIEWLLEEGCGAIIPILSGDRLSPHAIDSLALCLGQDVSWAYGDCDCDTLDNSRSAPWLKPTWDLDLFMAADIFTPGAIISSSTLIEALNLLSSFDDRKYSWDFLTSSLALVTTMRNLRVAHLPNIIYHRHPNRPTSPALSAVDINRQQAVSWLAQRVTVHGAEVEPVALFPGLLRVEKHLPADMPSVSVIVPTRDQAALLKTCIEGLLSSTDYPSLEIIVVDNQSKDSEALDYLADLPRRGVKVIPHPKIFNYSEINNRAAEIANGEYLCLLNNDIEIMDPDWLKNLIRQVIQKDVGIVGAKLCWANRMVQHAGVIYGINGLAAHVGNALHDDDAGYLGFNQITRKYSAVTAACLVIAKDIYIKAGGLDEVAFPVAFNDVDFCLRVQALNLKIIWCADSKLFHLESASRGKDIAIDKRMRAEREQNNFIIRWKTGENVDPCYHPMLSHDYLSGPFGGLAMPPRAFIPRY